MLQGALDAYWSLPPERLALVLDVSPSGLTTAQAETRLHQYGPNVLQEHERATLFRLFFRQFTSPLVLILVFAAIVSAIVRNWVDSLIILAILLGSAVLTMLQEYRASAAVERLRQRMMLRASVLRDGEVQSVPAAELVPGDVVLLSAGSLVPADGVVLEAKDFFVTQAVLTGETFPVEKQPGIAAPQAVLPERTNCVFMGTSVRSGTARALIVHTGMNTAYGHIAERLSLRAPEAEFERGIRQFGYLLTRIMLALVVAVLVINVVFERPAIESLLFAIALAVGLSPELLPAILTITLARGAQDMARRGVIVRRLSAIENLGGMDILCSDKTGTLTEGMVHLDAAFDMNGRSSAELLRFAYLNAHFQTGIANPLDDAIVAAGERQDLSSVGWRKIDEIPYDFLRRRLSVVVQEDRHGAMPLMIMKGALVNVLEVCTQVQDGCEVRLLDETMRAAIERQFSGWSGQGYRVLGVAIKAVPLKPRYEHADENELVFAGFLLFFDPPKTGVAQHLADLGRLGVELKLITGDNRLVALHVAEAVGMQQPIEVLSGADLDALADEALWHRAEHTRLFVEVDPNQKERIILALRRTGHVVGYIGDGINDAPALHAADVGISVDTAVDVAKEAADFVLLERDLDVLRRGIEEGRSTFANTLKYIYITTSANFGNMISMAFASLFLPFLPLLAKQILLNNFLSDFPAMTIAGDNVDRETVERPHRWDMRSIRNFMVVFGAVSSVFDVLTFGVLLLLVGAVPELFRTGWFVESLLTELLIVLIVRTRKPFYASRPGRWLLWSTVAVTLLTLTLPYLPYMELFAFEPLPWSVIAVVLLITALYLGASELAKRYFYRHAV